MDNNSPEPQALLPGTALATPATRHGGWSGEKMANFCEILAETAVVAEACDQVGMGTSSAYALRRRNPVFAAAWDAALTIARERLADTLLARAMEGNSELIYRDGEIIGRRDVLDNRLGLAILRRLDRLAETGRATSVRGEPAAAPAVRPECRRGANAPAIIPESFDWQHMVDALRTGEPDDIARALAVLKSYEVDEVDDPPNSLNEEGNGEAEVDFSLRCWFDENSHMWVTDFPPPEGFDGEENGEWSDRDYWRSCTPEETAILEADEKSALDEEIAEDAAKRDLWFALLAERQLEDEEAGAEAPGRERVGSAGG